MDTHTTLHMSASGQVEIPARIRAILQWEGDMELDFRLTPSGLLIQPTQTSRRGPRLEELRGMLKHKGTPLTDAQLCAPVDLGNEA